MKLLTILLATLALEFTAVYALRMKFISTHKLSISKISIDMTVSNDSLNVSPLRTLKKGLLLGFLSVALFGGDILYELSTSSTIDKSIVLADSTGKFSTKLTARKRYLPRIVNGVAEFKIVTKNPTKDSLTQFVDVTLPNLERAMKLYGASLRKGETPDEISRNAEKLTDKFKTIGSELNKASSADLPFIIGKAKEILNEYLKFASLAEIDSSDYNNIVPVSK